MTQETTQAVNETAKTVNETAKTVNETAKTVGDSIEVAASTLDGAVDKVIEKTGTISDAIAGAASNSDLLANLEDKLNAVVNAVASNSQQGWDLLMLPLQISAGQTIVTALVGIILSVWLFSKSWNYLQYIISATDTYKTGEPDRKDVELYKLYTNGKTYEQNDQIHRVLPSVGIAVTGVLFVIFVVDLTQIMNWVQVFVPEVKFAAMLLEKFMGTIN